MSLCSKCEVMDYIWTSSHFYHSCLVQCERLYEEEIGYSAVMVLFNCLENIAKCATDDYDSNLHTVFKKLYENDIITQKEHSFLNEGDYCIRKIRNLYAHSNAATINFIEKDGEKEMLWPLTENETSLMIYSKLSPILFNLMIKILAPNFIDSVKEKFQIALDDKLDVSILKYKVLTYKELLVLKGYPEDYIPNDIDIPEEAKVRMVDNAPDVNMYMHILSGLKDAILNEEKTNNS